MTNYQSTTWSFFFQTRLIWLVCLGHWTDKYFLHSFWHLISSIGSLTSSSGVTHLFIVKEEIVTQLLLVISRDLLSKRGLFRFRSRNKLWCTFLFSESVAFLRKNLNRKQSQHTKDRPKNKQKPSLILRNFINIYRMWVFQRTMRCFAVFSSDNRFDPWRPKVSRQGKIVI